MALESSKSCNFCLFKVLICSLLSVGSNGLNKPKVLISKLPCLLIDNTRSILKLIFGFSRDQSMTSTCLFRPFQREIH